MQGFRVAQETLLDQVVPMAASHSERWRQGFHRIIAAYNHTAGQALTRAYDLPAELVSNDSTQQRIAQAQHYFFAGLDEELDGYLHGWLLCHREDFQQVIWAHVEGLQAGDQLRGRMYEFLR